MGPVEERNDLALRSVLAAALASGRPFPALHAAAKSLAAAHGRKAAQEALEHLRSRLELEREEAAENLVIDVLDCLVGWCGKADAI